MRSAKISVDLNFKLFSKHILTILTFFSIRLEREYTRTKSKEVEDSEEIRRLKTEKSLLRHRVDKLEDVRE